MKLSRNAGFSLIELMVVIAILGVLSSIVFLNPQVVKRKEIDKYARELSSQITLIQTISMAKAGEWRLAMYKDNDRYYCVQEKKQPESEGNSWVSQTGETPLGLANGVTYEKKDVSPSLDVSDRSLIFTWRFDRDTGSCLEGSGIYFITGANKSKQIKVYAQSGRCEVTDIR